MNMWVKLMEMDVPGEGREGRRERRTASSTTRQRMDYGAQDRVT